MPSRPFRNAGDGTFTDVTEEVGLEVEAFVKGVTWGDYDNDGDPDLYVSVLGGPNQLLRNDRVGDAVRFVDVAEEAGVTGPESSFPVWFWDYDNDGFLDLYVSGYRMRLADAAREALGLPHEAELPRLYRNRGDGTFADVTGAVGLDRIQYAMGSNFGDLNADGYLDILVGTGDPGYEAVLPNRAFLNDGGARFREVTVPGGLGRIQKGHAVSFADADHDGDEDILMNMGGATEADRARNVFYLNPGSPEAWVTLVLEGTRANRAALGARVTVRVREGGRRWKVVRDVTPGGSFGANSLALELGLGSADAVEEVRVRWPSSGAPVERFEGVELGGAFRLVEGTGAAEPLARSPLVLAGAPGTAK